MVITACLWCRSVYSFVMCVFVNTNYLWLQSICLTCVYLAVRKVRSCVDIVKDFKICYRKLTHDTGISTGNKKQPKYIDWFFSDDDCECSSLWYYSVNACEQHRQLLEVDSFKRWPKLVLLFKTWEGRDSIGLQRMVMVRKHGKFIKSKIYFVSILLLSW